MKKKKKKRSDFKVSIVKKKIDGVEIDVRVKKVKHKRKVKKRGQKRKTKK
jgi:hypothetical protein